VLVNSPSAGWSGSNAVATIAAGSRYRGRWADRLSAKEADSILRSRPSPVSLADSGSEQRVHAADPPDYWVA
jgi:hypothetical protein